MKDFSYITNSHPSFIEGMYQQFIQDPNSVDPDLKKFFEGFDFAMQNGNDKSMNVASTGQDKVKVIASVSSDHSNALSINWAKEIAAYRLILGYRNKGHLIAKTNPIRERKDRHANLELEFFNLTEADLSNTFYAGNLLGLGETSLQNIIEHLQNAYEKNTGIQFKYITDQTKVD